MVTVTVQVKIPHNDIFGAKEQIAALLEDIGEVHVISVTDEKSVMERIEEFIANH